MVWSYKRRPINGTERNRHSSNVIDTSKGDEDLRNFG